MENLVGKKFNKLTVEGFDHKEVKMGKSKKNILLLLEM